MKKLPLALALGAAFIGSAASAQVSVYGRLYPFLVQEKLTGASAVGTTVSSLTSAIAATPADKTIVGMAAGNSHIGFRGTEDLGGGLKASFQLEGVASVDNGTGASDGGGFMFDRNTFVGLSGGFGKVQLGRFDSVFKEMGDKLGILGTSSGTPMSSSGVLRNVGFGTSSSTSRFHERLGNSVQYTAPELGGFKAAIQYSMGEANIGVQDRRAWSYGVEYEVGPFEFAVAQEVHHDYFGGSANAPSSQRNNGAADQSLLNSKDTATEFSVTWAINKQHKVAFDYNKKRYNETAKVTGRFQSYNQSAWMVSMENRWSDQWRTSAHYVKASAGTCTRVATACSTTGLEGSKFTAGAAYYMNRRTYVYGVVSKLTNGASAVYRNDFSGNRPAAGQDISHLILGISRAF
jgi:predicted porin